VSPFTGSSSLDRFQTSQFIPVRLARWSYCWCSHSGQTPGPPTCQGRRPPTGIAGRLTKNRRRYRPSCVPSARTGLSSGGPQRLKSIRASTSTLVRTTGYVPRLPPLSSSLGSTFPTLQKSLNFCNRFLQTGRCSFWEWEKGYVEFILARWPRLFIMAPQDDADG
jgi:hypothetical protein